MMTYLRFDPHPDAPILYQDVDDVLIRFPPFETEEWWKKYPNGGPANGIEEYFKFIRTHFEVRWLTARCPSGKMDREVKWEIANILGIDRRYFWDIENPKSYFDQSKDGKFSTLKTNGIDWEAFKAGRPFVWIEDKILDNEKVILKSYNALDNYIYCNTSQNPNQLYEVMNKLKKRFNL